jgi:hypothetical protein
MSNIIVFPGSRKADANISVNTESHRLSASAPANSKMDGAACGRLYGLLLRLRTGSQPIDADREPGGQRSRTEGSNEIPAGHTQKKEKMGGPTQAEGMMDEAAELDILEFMGRRVVTLAMIDKINHRKQGAAKKSFDRNRLRFVEGEDYFAVRAVDNGASFLSTDSDPTVVTFLFTEFGYVAVSCLTVSASRIVHRSGSGKPHPGPSLSLDPTSFELPGP